MPKGKTEGPVSRWRCLCAYDGTEFAGWQKQPSGLAVQDKIEEALGNILGQAVRTVGSGRTDAGVHAQGQVFHFDAPWPHPESALLQAMRVNFPAGILAVEIKKAPDDFHALLSANGKRYRYRVHRGWAMPEQDRFVYSLKGKALDLSLIREGMSVLLGEHDFSAFSAKRGDEEEEESKIREVRKFFLEEKEEELHFVVEGNGFLYKMVRGLVGALLDLGAGKLDITQLQSILEFRQRTEKVVSAPAKGLCLETVFYREVSA